MRWIRIFPGGSEDETASTLIQAADPIQFLVVIGLRSHFLVSCHLGTDLDSYRLPTFLLMLSI